MAITKLECTELLHDQFILDFSQKDNPSRLTHNSWWNNHWECLSYFDNSYVKIKETLGQREKPAEQWNFWKKKEKRKTVLIN